MFILFDHELLAMKCSSFSHNNVVIKERVRMEEYEK